MKTKNRNWATYLFTSAKCCT